jgi:hypothetical protein
MCCRIKGEFAQKELWIIVKFLKIIVPLNLASIYVKHSRT